MLLALNRGNAAVQIHLDLSVAFDTIDHTVLQNQLQWAFGVTGSALTQMEPYLKGRFQVMTIYGCKSRPIPLD